MPKKDTDVMVKLEKFRQKEAESLARALSEKYGLSYVDLSRMTINLDALKLVPEKEAREARLAVFQKVAKKLQIAVLNPELLKTKDIVKTLEEDGFKTKLFLASEIGLEHAWSRYKEVPAFEEIQTGLIDISPQRLEEFSNKIKNIKDLQAIIGPQLSTKEMRKTSEAVEIVLAGALALDASDIHFEPGEIQTRVRFRLDGVLYDAASFKTESYGLILSRIKLLAEMKLNIHDRAQDGRFTVRTERADIEIRASSLPESYGETIVLRILNPKTISIDLKDLGMHPEFLKTLEEELKRPNGMILTTGPTGSGKTTTLYAFVKRVNKPNINIITIEDPVEYHIPGINQTQVDSKRGYDFANGLRSILRQDPDMILVGEIRDLETAEIAMHAALTGHLVFSTLHTNNAAGTIPRLIDLKADPTIIAPAVNISMAQRLVRKLCGTCKKEEKPSAEEEKTIKKALKDMPPKYKKDVSKKITLWRSGGCAECSNLGYKGRIGIFEVLLIDDKVEKMILEKPSESELKDEMKRQEIPTMFQDGILKVLSGTTSIEELERVSSE